jgi:cell division protein FtsI (penicillin-binding protein 3)
MSGRRTASGAPRPAVRLAADDGRIRLEGLRKNALEVGRNRLFVTAVVFTFLFLAVAGRVVDLMAFGGATEPSLADSRPVQAPVADRANIVDRNGVLLATSLPAASLYANPRHLSRAGEKPESVAARLVRVLPDLDRADVAAKLGSDRAFVYLQRTLTPEQQYEVNRLGIPGLYFQHEERRVYPQGSLAAHVLGMTDIDGNGIAGAERQFDASLRGDAGPLRLSLDVRLQEVLHEELGAAKSTFDALGAAGVIMDVDTGEVLAMVSLPDFDPNDPATAQGEAAFNRVTAGVYEMGSTFKLINTAIALDSGVADLKSRYDATEPLRVARFTIRDYHATHSWLTVPEILLYSSNIGSARMASQLGTALQREYLDRFGLLDRAEVELPEVGTPLLPSPWRDINTMTIAYGHGIAVSPLQLASAVSALIDGGVRHPATMLRRAPGAPLPGERVVSPDTSRKMRALMRLVVRSGTGRNAEVPGYLVGGKTGSAEKPGKGHYRRKALLSSFIGAFPSDEPRYLVLAILDEPHGTKETHGFATGGWVAAPVVRRVIERIGPMMGIAPRPQADPGETPGNPLFVRARTSL